MGNLGDSLIQKTLTIIVAVVLLVIMILTLYQCLYKAHRESLKVTGELTDQNSRSKRNITFHNIVVGLTNVLDAIISVLFGIMFQKQVSSNFVILDNTIYHAY